MSPRTRTSRREHWIAAVFFAAAAIAFLWPAFARFDEASYTSADFSQIYSLTSSDARFRPGNAALSDPVVEMLPWLEFDKSELFAGRLPTWNPWNGAGVPHLANAQSAVFSPFSLPFYLAPLKIALIASAFLKLVSLGIFTYLFLRALKLGLAAACTGGLIFEFGGHNVLLLAYPHPAVAVALPAALWVIERAWIAIESGDSGSRRIIPWVVGLALVFATALLAGSPETAAFAIAVSAVYAVSRGVSFLRSNPTRRREGAVALGWLALGALLGLVIAAVQVLPFLEYAANSSLIETRQDGFDGLRATNWPLQFFPDLLGNPSQRYWPRPDLPHPNYEAANTCYFGPLTWLLAIAGAVCGRRRFVGVFFAALSVVWIAMAFDFDAMRPLMIAFTALSHAPMNRSQFVPLCALAVLTALAVDAFKPGERRAAWTAFAATIALAAGMIWLAHRGAERLVQDSWPDGPPGGQAIRVPPHLRFVTWTVCLGTVVFASLAIARASWMRNILLAGLFGFLFAQSGWLMRGFNPLSKDERVFPRTESLSTIAAAIGTARLQVIGEDTLPPQMNMVYGIADVAVYDALNIAAYDKLYARLFQSRGNWRETLQTTDHALKTLGIEYVLARDEWPRLNPGLAIDPDAAMAKPRECLPRKWREVNQTFRVASAGLDRVYLALGAEDDPIPAFLDLTLTDVATGESIAVRRLDTHSLREGMSRKPLSLFAHDLRFASPTAWVQLAFAPRVDSAGRTYRLQLEQASGEWKNGFIAWAVDDRATDERSLTIDGALSERARLCFDWSTNVSRDLDDVATIPPFTLYRFRSGRGRFWTVHETRRAPDAESALAMTLSADHDPNEVAIVEGVGLLENSAGGATAADPRPEVVEDSPRRVMLRVNTARDAWLVAALSWYPGWKARLDGASVPLTRTNSAFLGLPVRAGEHEVVLEFESDTVHLGAWISVLGLCAVAGLLASRRWPR